jgi:lipoprotein-anchoring transpeptidase ErfK/SrfK
MYRSLHRINRRNRRLGPAKRSLTVVLWILLFAAVQTATATAEAIPPEQETVALYGTHAVWSAPGANADRVATVRRHRPITRVATVLPVLSHGTGASGDSWLQVRLPGRTIAQGSPQTGWISARETRAGSTSWHLTVDVGARRVAVYRDGNRVRSYRAVVGKPSTPTPHGEYFVEESVRVPGSQPGGPFALATSARSNVLQEFEGGPGQIAIHGRDNLGGRLGTAVSHGCVRLGSGAIRWLAARIGPGVPVTIF